MPLRGLSTRGQGQREGPAGDKFRDSGTQETVGGSGANEVSGVLEEASYCRCEAPPIGIALQGDKNCVIVDWNAVFEADAFVREEDELGGVPDAKRLD